MSVSLTTFLFASILVFWKAIIELILFINYFNPFDYLLIVICNIFTFYRLHTHIYKLFFWNLFGWLFLEGFIFTIKVRWNLGILIMIFGHKFIIVWLFLLALIVIETKSHLVDHPCIKNLLLIFLKNGRIRYFIVLEGNFLKKTGLTWC